MTKSNKASILFEPNFVGAIRGRAVDQHTLDQMLAAGEVEIRPGTPTTYRIKPKATAPFHPEDGEDEGQDLELSSPIYNTKVMTAASPAPRRTVPKRV